MKYLYVGAMAEVDGDALAAIGERLAEEFAAPVRNLELPAADFAYHPARRQCGSIPVLGTLIERCPEDALKLIAVTERDLFIPVLTFVYGHAQLGGRVAVVSLARLRQEFYGMPPIGPFLSSAPSRRRSTKPAILSAWCIARIASAPCAWLPTFARSI